MVICRNAEWVHGQRKVGNPWSKCFKIDITCYTLEGGASKTKLLDYDKPACICSWKGNIRESKNFTKWDGL